jgi:hypothetical protein
MSSKFREALEVIAEICDGKDIGGLDRIVGIYNIAKAALDEPVRNCDVGTPTEQKARYEAFCKECQRITRDYPCDFNSECIFKWSQMPYKEESK